MVQIPFYRWWVARTWLCALVSAACCGLPGVVSAAAADSSDASPAVGLMNCEPAFGPIEQYDTGAQTSIAAHPSSLVVECHKSQFNEEIWYRLGKVDGEKILWGGSRRLDDTGYWPAVAISKEGYVIVVHSDRAAKNMAQLFL